MSNINNAVVGGRLLRFLERERDRQVLNRPEESVGDNCNNMDKDCFRLMSQNINGIGQEANNTKEMGIKKFVKDFKVDIFALQ